MPDTVDIFVIKFGGRPILGRDWFRRNKVNLIQLQYGTKLFIKIFFELVSKILGSILYKSGTFAG